MRSTSNSARMRSSRLTSVIDPVNSRATSFASGRSSGLTSIVMIGGPPPSGGASRVISPWPISPPAPVIRTTGLRMFARPQLGTTRRHQHVHGRVDDDDEHEPAYVVERQRGHEEGGDQHGGHRADRETP